MTSLPLISVVLATYNRAETLKTTLDHLARQTLPPGAFEVLVIDDGSPDNTAEVVAQCTPNLPFKLTYLRHENQGPGYTQNRGIRAATAPLICLMADDIWLAPGALAAHVERHKAHPEPEVAVLGQVMQSPELKQSVFLQKWDPFKFRDLRGMSELPYYYFWACNISCKRAFMLDHGMFRDEKGRAGAAAHEDVELGYRLSHHGLRIIYSEAACGHHYHIEDLAGANRRAYQRGLNWETFRKQVDDPEISIRYHVLNRHSVRDYVYAFKRNNKQLGPDRNPLLLLSRIALRMALFNTLTVRYAWLPMAYAAEHSPMFAKLMHRQLYRGIISYHFFKGASDAEMVFSRTEGYDKHAPKC
jgi:glycosyltransferase involved in cell wall biosynthesis